MVTVFNYIIDFLKEDKGLRKEMHCIYKWCKKRNMTDNAAIVAACVVEVIKSAAAIAITAVVSTLMLIAVLLMV